MMTRSATTALLIAAGLLAVLAPAVLAENQQTLDFPITTLRADSTRVGVHAARSQQEQSGNPQYITAHPDKGLVVSLGAPSDGMKGNQLTVVRQNLQAIEAGANNKQSRVGGMYILPERATCELPLIGKNARQFNVTGNDSGVLRVDCVGGDTLELRGQGAKCISTWLPSVNTIRVQGKGQQEIIFRPTSGNSVPSRISYTPDFFSTASDTRLVLEMPRLASGSRNYTVIVEGKLPFGTIGQPAVVVRGCNVEAAVKCEVYDVQGESACKFENKCVDTRADAVAWIKQRRDLGECPPLVA